MSLAEKFQITVPAKKEVGKKHEWASFSSVQDLRGSPNPAEDENFNNLPISQINVQNEFHQTFGGADDVSGGVTPKTLKDGFARKEMKSTDDQYGGEHVDLFYGEVVDEDGNHGCVERNNYLDRL